MADPTDPQFWLEQYSRSLATAVEVRTRLGNITYGELLSLMAEAGLPMPRASQTGREKDIAQARAWMFPQHAD